MPLVILLGVQPAIAHVQQSHDDAQDTERDEAVITEKVAVDYVADDAAIQQWLERILSASDRFRSQAVEVDEGIVILRGETNTPEHQEWATDVAERTEDVVAVINHMTVSDTVDMGGSLEVVTGSLTTLWNDFLKRLPLLVAAFAIVVLTWIAAKIASA